MSKDFFQHKARSYEQTDHRVKNVDNIANAILNRIDFTNTHHIMDFGSGTGLLLERVAPQVDTVTAVDVSASMNAQLEKKRAELACELEILQVDLCSVDLDQRFDGVISSMTLHHINDIPALSSKLRSLLVPGGFIAIADLDIEDGSFHSEDTGVHHHGFDRQALAEQFTKAGFTDVMVGDASVVHKPQGDYPVFLLTAVSQ